MLRKNVAAVLAGGIGSRFQSALPKQFAMIDDKTVLEYSISAFDNNELIDEIVVVIHPDYFSDISEMAAKNQWHKVRHIVNGGKERYESSLNAVNLYRDSTDEINILLHDSARPLVSDRIITDTIHSLERYSAAAVAVPAIDTIVRVDRDSLNVSSTLNRNELYHMQTPQAFHLEIISEAYKAALNDPDFSATDDTGVVMKNMPDTEIHIIEGERKNLKLTHKEDLDIIKLYAGK